MKIAPDSTITCPICGHAHLEVIPTDNWQVFYECRSFSDILRAKRD